MIERNTDNNTPAALPPAVFAKYAIHSSILSCGFPETSNQGCDDDEGAGGWCDLPPDVWITRPIRKNRHRLSLSALGPILGIDPRELLWTGRLVREHRWIL